MKGKKRAALALGALAALPPLSAYALFRLGFCRTGHNIFFSTDALFDKYRRAIEAEARWLESLPREKLTIRSFDGLRLSARYFPREGSRGTMLLVHGYRSLGSHDFALALRYFYEQGFSILLPDGRVCGESEGKYITFGVFERYDCVSWAKEASRRFGKDRPLYLCGISMGATAVLCASCLGLPGNVRGIVADCGFTTPRAMIGIVAKRAHIPAFPTLALIEGYCKRLAGFGFDDCSTVSSLEKSDIPVLFVHGDADAVVPPEMTLENYRACRAHKRLLLAEGAGHGESFAAANDRFRAEFEAFIDETIEDARV